MSTLYELTEMDFDDLGREVNKSLRELRDAIESAGGECPPEWFAAKGSIDGTIDSIRRNAKVTSRPQANGFDKLVSDLLGIIAEGTTGNADEDLSGPMTEWLANLDEAALRVRIAQGSQTPIKN